MNVLCLFLIFSDAPPSRPESGGLVPPAQPVTATVTVFAYDTPGHTFRHSHSWAVFEQAGERVVISWGPKFGAGVEAIRTPVAGHNYSHEDTLAFAAQMKLKVTQYGPYNVHPDLFAKASLWSTHLASGSVQYVLLDHTRRPLACNCASALFFVGNARPPTGLKHGFTASAAVARFYLRHWGLSNEVPFLHSTCRGGL